MSLADHAPVLGSKVMIFSGNSNRPLAQAIANYLTLPLGKATVSRFSDGEINVDIQDNVRGRDIFLIQTTSAPTNDNLMEMLVMVDALRRASVHKIIAVVPYFGYARQDRRVRSARVPITAKLVANMMDAAGVDHLLTVDLHADQIQGFFNVPVDNVYASPILLADIWQRKSENLIVVSPDVGGVVRARANHTTHIGRDHDQVLGLTLPDIGQQNRRSVDVIDRNVEKTLNLISMQIDRE